MINLVTPQEAKQFLGSKDAIFVDIRDGASFAESHILGAFNLNGENMDAFIQGTDKNMTVVCYCYHGISSLQAGQYFLDCGFEKVYSLSGGFEAWENHEVANDAKKNGH